jgi:hypothetical protein
MTDEITLLVAERDDERRDDLAAICWPTATRPAPRGP